MKPSIRKGFSFGLTSGIITTLGLIIGLNSSLHSKLIIVTGIFVIAFADALSDAFGIHISTESEKKTSVKEIWESTISTFIFKLFFALTFVIPILLFTLPTAIAISIFWGLLLITLMSIYTAKKQKTSKIKMVSEHLLITLIVILVTHYIGSFISGLNL